jgi:hypothetical protein
MKLDYEQMGHMSLAALQAFEQRMIDLLRGPWRRVFDQRGEPWVRAFIRRELPRALGFGLRLEHHTAHYLNLALAIEVDLAETTDAAWSAAIMTDPEHTPTGKIYRLTVEVTRRYKTLAG